MNLPFSNKTLKVKKFSYTFGMLKISFLFKFSKHIFEEFFSLSFSTWNKFLAHDEAPFKNTIHNLLISFFLLKHYI